MTGKTSFFTSQMAMFQLFMGIVRSFLSKLHILYS